ncbi:MAG: hypothetical protein LBK70_00355 [Clostridiales bacterium]|nr:hypothetical protein [Clostridiales bacterium]
MDTVTNPIFSALQNPKIYTLKDNGTSIKTVGKRIYLRTDLIKRYYAVNNEPKDIMDIVELMRLGLRQF